MVKELGHAWAKKLPTLLIINWKIFMMKISKRIKLIAPIAGIALLAACNDNANTPAEKSGQAYVSGLVAIGEVSASTITVYDFSNCKIGAVLATTGAQNSATFAFDIRSDEVEMPILVEASNITYNEDIGGLEVSSDTAKLYSAAVLKDGDDSDVAISHWTTLSYARTVNLCKNSPENVATYISESNAQFSSALKFDIISDLPLPLSTQVISFEEISRMQYGIAIAAISKYSYKVDIENAGVSAPHTIYNSIAFADIAYRDLEFDGFLNGTGAAGALYFPENTVTPLMLDVYRSDIPRNMEDVISMVIDRPTFSTNLAGVTAASFQASNLDIFGSVNGELPSLEDTTLPIIRNKRYSNSCNTTVSGNYLTYEILFDIEEPDSQVTATATIVDGCPQADNSKLGFGRCSIPDAINLVNGTSDPITQEKSKITLSFISSYLNNGYGQDADRIVDISVANRTGVVNQRITVSLNSCWRNVF